LSGPFLLFLTTIEYSGKKAEVKKLQALYKKLLKKEGANFHARVKTRMERTLFNCQ